MKAKFKICCIQNVLEAEMAINAGAHAIGLVTAMPSGPGVIDETKIPEVVAFAKGKTDIFLLTCETGADALIGQFRKFRPDCLQLVDYITDETYRILRREIPEAELVQVVHVEGVPSINLAIHFAGLADRLLLDSGNPGADIKILGGTGKTHNWVISRKIVQTVDVPVYLAGGLNPGNVSEAIEKVGPFGVDICSGLRHDGILQHTLLRDFVENLL